MYKHLLCLRYLRSRYIALASIVSVMLGVATMIVVNSVMAGFREEMYKRIHGILSDIVVESHGMDGIRNPTVIVQRIREAVGEDLEGMTSTVHVPAMLAFEVPGRSRQEWITRQVTLIGIDHHTYAQVSDFSKYLLHPSNREQLELNLRESGYDERLGDAGWDYRRRRIAWQRAYTAEMNRLEALEAQRQAAQQESAQHSPNQPTTEQLTAEQPTTDQPATELSPSDQPTGADTESALAGGEASGGEASGGDEFGGLVDPYAAAGSSESKPQFDEMVDQHPGIVLGIGISGWRGRNAQGEVQDVFLSRPGDNVRVTIPTAGTPPSARNAYFTVVDLYESKMSEYDSSFAFCSIAELQQIRQMLGAGTADAAVTSIQLRLRRGADLNAIRDRLRTIFPSPEYAYQIQTWRDLQGPLLSAVQLETTILNILLFLIIAVAGFGILATFFMIVVEKTRDIGILKSLGASNRGVMGIFLGYGLSLGMVGSGVGMVLGLLFVVNINRIADLLESLTGQEVFDPTVYYFQEIPTIIQPWTVAWIVAGAMLIAVLASILPALRAARMHPVEALRYE
ncbi:MAG: FtsX-like permease family protein [Pirellulales bacterium]